MKSYSLYGGVKQRPPGLKLILGLILALVGGLLGLYMAKSLINGFIDSRAPKEATCDELKYMGDKPIARCQGVRQ